MSYCIVLYLTLSNFSVLLMMPIYTNIDSRPFYVDYPMTPNPWDLLSNDTNEPHDVNNPCA